MQSTFITEKASLLDGVTLALGQITAFRGLSQIERILSILPTSLAGDVARLRLDIGLSKMGYLFGDLRAETEDLRQVAISIEHIVGYPVLIITDLLPMEWVKRLRELAPVDDDYAAVFQIFFARGVVSDLFVCHGWEQLPCVPQLVRAAAEKGLRLWFTHNGCEIEPLVLEAEIEAEM